LWRRALKRALVKRKRKHQLCGRKRDEKERRKRPIPPNAGKKIREFAHRVLPLQPRKEGKMTLVQLFSRHKKKSVERTIGNPLVRDVEKRR
jgi:hypothetical protein